MQQELWTPSAPRRQRGITMFGLLFWAILIGFDGAGGHACGPDRSSSTTRS